MQTHRGRLLCPDFLSPDCRVHEFINTYLQGNNMKKFAAAVLLAGASAPAFALTEAEISARLEQMANEIEALKSELKRVKEQQTAPPANATATAPGASAYGALTAGASSATAAEPATTFTGYGEINYNRPRHNSGEAQLDVRRAVLGVNHRFDDHTRFTFELEVEHAVASAGDRGEVAIEQAYIERQLTANTALTTGLFLIPSGLLNRNHEPTAYHGVERNFVETAIIPSTWREVGVSLRGSPDSGFLRGFEWNVGVTSGFDLNKFDSKSDDARESPLASIHQEGQLARARDLSTYGALEYKGLPNLLVGGSLFTGKAGQGQADFPARNARVTLWEGHARYTPGRWDLSALYALGRISGTRDLNLTFAGNPTPVPKEFFGWYVQGAYAVWTNGDASLAPFARYERFNTAYKYEELPPGLGIAPSATEGVTTVGLSYKINPGVVFKADYQKFKVDNQRDRFNLGVGYAF